MKNQCYKRRPRRQTLHRLVIAHQRLGAAAAQPNYKIT